MKHVLSVSDQELTALLRKGDRKAYAEIFERFHDVLYSHAYNKLRNSDEAHDVVQDVFVKLWNLREETEIQQLSAYLYTMLRNQIFSLIKHKQIVTDYSESFNAFKAQSYVFTDYLIREKQLMELIEREIQALPPRTREVFELSRKNFLSNKEIALRLNLSEHTVADQMKKALRQLRLKLGGLIVLIAFLSN